MEVQELGYLDTSTREAWPGEPIGVPKQEELEDYLELEGVPYGGSEVLSSNSLQ
jgi:hypothetical protein